MPSPLVRVAFGACLKTVVSNGYSGLLSRPPVPPRVGNFVFGPQLSAQFFADVRRTSRTASAAGDDGSDELRPSESHPLCAFTALDHDLLRAPPVGPTEFHHVLDFVVRWDALNYPHTITSSLLFP